MLERNKPWLTPLIIGLGLIILFLDYFTILGTAVYIFYFIPVAISAIHSNRQMPIYVAILCTLFAITGQAISPDGIAEIVSLTNRGVGVFTLWCIAFLVRKIIINRENDLEQVWIRSGQGVIVETIRGELSIEELGEKALAELADYTEANIEAMYLANHSEKSLKRIAGYAYYTADNMKAESFSFGEGIIGQVVKEKEVKTYTNLSESFMSIKSATGEMPPRHIMIIPLIAYKQVQAVIELGFLNAPSDSVHELMEVIAEPLGVAVCSALHKERLAELLEASRQQTEELQVQQEELRVTNEELEQQTSALKNSQAQLENQQAELEQINQQLEEQTQDLERQKEYVEERNQRLIDAQGLLRQKALELEKASQYKTEFLANMSHELRTPLNSSLILSQLLAENREGNLTAEQVKFAETILSSGNDLLSLINDILDLSKVEAGKLDVRPEPMSVPALMNSLERSFTNLAEEKNVKFSTEILAGSPQKLITDKQRLEQILKNFLSNAFKFTHEGEVKIRVKPDTIGLAFEISDTGIGIPEDQQQTIFEAFRQADGTTNRKYGGTGLGLSISQKLASLLKGEISIKSEVGKGSIFTLHLPEDYEAVETSVPASDSAVEASIPVVAKAPVAKVGKEEKRLMKEILHKTEKSAIPVFSFEDDRNKITEDSRKILIIEDDESFAKILFDLAHEMGFVALVASSGVEGIELTKEHHPNAIMLDIRLPDHNGLAILDQLKSNPDTRHIPVHMISSDDFSRVALQMGAASYLMKPVQREEILKSVSDLQTRLKQKFKRVLIVEDDKVQRESMVHLIADVGAEIKAVGTSGEALELLAEQTFDCMVMDLSLPDLSGYELLERLAESDSAYSFPPVIVYTGRDLSREDEEKLRQYSQSIIIKGARSPERLLSEVTLFLHRIESELPPERQKMLRELRNREKTLEERKILIVDDDVRNIFSLTSVLEAQGANIEVARNGKEAIDKLDKVSDIDLVLMDIMMPEMNGYEATKVLRNDKRFKKLPIIAVTAKAMRDDQEKCLSVGANDYISKPVEVDKLLSLIRVWMPQMKGARV